MQRVFADTSFFYSLADQNEGEYHQKAKSWMKGHHGQVQLYSSNYIFDELATLLLARTDKSICLKFCKSMRASPSIVWHFLTESEEEQSWELFNQYSDKEWSFTDCTSFKIMSSLKLDSVLTWDHHFTQMGFGLIL